MTTRGILMLLSGAKWRTYRTSHYFGFGSCGMPDFSRDALVYPYGIEGDMKWRVHIVHGPVFLLGSFEEAQKRAEKLWLEGQAGLRQQDERG